VTNLSVNRARSTAPAIFVVGCAVQQLWLFIVYPALTGESLRESPRAAAASA
jgi:hypothetical protein